MAGSNMLAEDNGMRVAAGAFIGAKSGALLVASAETPFFGLRNCGYTAPGQLVAVNRPIAISQIRVKFFALTAFTAGTFAFEVHKTTSTANYTTGGTQLQAQRKKVSDYPAIPSTELDIMIASTGGLTGGSQLIQGSESNPFDVAVGGGAAETLPAFESVWWAQDGLPLVIEQNEGLIVHNANAFAGGGSGILFVGIDLYRY